MSIYILNTLALIIIVSLGMTAFECHQEQKHQQVGEGSFKLAARCQNCPKRLAVQCYGTRKYQRAICPK